MGVLNGAVLGPFDQNRGAALACPRDVALDCYCDFVAWIDSSPSGDVQLPQPVPTILSPRRLGEPAQV